MHRPSVILFVLGTWFLLSILRQFFTAGQMAEVARLGAAKLMPRWHLFTADLRRLDVYMYIRDFCEDGSMTAWKDVTPLGRHGGVRLVFADRRLVYGFVQFAQGLVGAMKSEPPQVMRLESPRRLMARRGYQALLHYARSQRAGPSAERRQFLIAVRPLPGSEGATEHTVPEFSFQNRVVRVVTPFHELNGRVSGAEEPPRDINVGGRASSFAWQESEDRDRSSGARSLSRSGLAEGVE